MTRGRRDKTFQTVDGVRWKVGGFGHLRRVNGNELGHPTRKIFSLVPNGVETETRTPLLASLRVQGRRCREEGSPHRCRLDLSGTPRLSKMDRTGSTRENKKRGSQKKYTNFTLCVSLYGLGLGVTCEPLKSTPLRRPCGSRSGKVGEGVPSWGLETPTPTGGAGTRPRCTPVGIYEKHGPQELRDGNGHQQTHPIGAGPRKVTHCVRCRATFGSGDTPYEPSKSQASGTLIPTTSVRTHTGNHTQRSQRRVGGRSYLKDPDHTSHKYPY